MPDSLEMQVEAALEAETQYDHGLSWAQFAGRIGAEPKRKRMRAILAAAFPEGAPNSLAVLNRLVRSLEGSGTQLNVAQEAAYEEAASFLDGALAPGGTPQIGGHWSDCATNGTPALPAGPCNCGATAFAEAEARGRRQGLEEAAIHLEDRADYFNRSPGYRNWDDAARSYRASAKEVRQIRATAPAETQKPEETT
jgi:hypothetical protein